MQRGVIFGILAMALVVTASNILVQYLYGDWLTWGAFTYPIAFLVTDLMNRIYGAPAARKVVFIGFAVGLLCSFIGTQIMGEFGPLVTLRIAIGSGTAFLIAQLTDIFVFNRLRERPGVDVAWANEAVPLLGKGPVAPLWVSLAVADFGVKLALALVALVPFRLIVTLCLTNRKEVI